MQRSRVLVTGASGAGTTALGRALADAWSVPHADVDDYFWKPTTPPYVVKRPVSERLALMETLFVARHAWVLSGSLMGWGDVLTDRLDAVVFLTLDPLTRLGRLKARERARYGDAIASGGTSEAEHQEFMDWARGYDDPSFEGRNRGRHDEWLSGLACPVLPLSSTEPVSQLVAAVTAWEPETIRLA